MCMCVCSNIDTRIQQAELQYKLGREELELLTLGEQARALAQLIEQADARASLEHTLYRSLLSLTLRNGSKDHPLDDVYSITTPMHIEKF